MLAPDIDRTRLRSGKRRAVQSLQPELLQLVERLEQRRPGRTRRWQRRRAKVTRVRLQALHQIIEDQRRVSAGGSDTRRPSAGCAASSASAPTTPARAASGGAGLTWTLLMDAKRVRPATPPARADLALGEVAPDHLGVESVALEMLEQLQMDARDLRGHRLLEGAEEEVPGFRVQCKILAGGQQCVHEYR